MACQRARNTGVRRSSSAHNASSQLTRGSSPVATVAAMRNLAGRRFSATSRYHDSAPRIAGSSQIFSLARSLMNSSIYCLGTSASRSAANHTYFNRILVLLQAFLISIFCCFFATSAGFGKWMCSTPLVKLRLDLRRIGIKWQRDRSAKRAIAAFNHVPVLVLVLFITRGLFLAAYGQDVVCECHVDILLIDTRQFCRNLDRILTLGNINLGRQRVRTEPREWSTP